MERIFFDYLAKHYTPTPLIPVRRETFYRIPEAQISRRTRFLFPRRSTVLGTTATTLLLYFVVPSDEKPPPVREAHVGGSSIPENQAGGSRGRPLCLPQLRILYRLE